MIKVTEKKWDYTLPDTLRKAIIAEDRDGIFAVLEQYVDILKDKGIMDEYDYDAFIEDIDNERDNYENHDEYGMDIDEIDENIDWLLDNFYDWCDASNVFIEI